MTKARLTLLAVLLGSGAALAVKPDKPGCRDHSLFPTRMPNYRLEACDVKEFAPVASNDNEEGRARNRRLELVRQ